MCRGVGRGGGGESGVWWGEGRRIETKKKNLFDRVIHYMLQLNLR